MNHRQLWDSITSERAFTGKPGILVYPERLNHLGVQYNYSNYPTFSCGILGGDGFVGRVPVVSSSARPFCATELVCFCVLQLRRSWPVSTGELIAGG